MSEKSVAEKAREDKLYWDNVRKTWETVGIVAGAVGGVVSAGAGAWALLKHNKKAREAFNKYGWKGVGNVGISELLAKSESPVVVDVNEVISVLPEIVDDDEIPAHIQKLGANAFPNFTPNAPDIGDDHLIRPYFSKFERELQAAKAKIIEDKKTPKAPDKGDDHFVQPYFSPLELALQAAKAKIMEDKKTQKMDISESPTTKSVFPDSTLKIAIPTAESVLPSKDSCSGWGSAESTESWISAESMEHSPIRISLSDATINQLKLGLKAINKPQPPIPTTQTIKPLSPMDQDISNLGKRQHISLSDGAINKLKPDLKSISKPQPPTPTTQTIKPLSPMDQDISHLGKRQNRDFKLDFPRRDSKKNIK
jgi:hypothetical protein